MSESGAASLLDLDGLASLYEEWKYGTGKNLIIVRSSSAIVSMAASALLVWILLRSRNGMKTPYHRLLLGLSVSDILLSLSFVTFGAVVPSELSYYIWNARGSRASCDAFGFFNTLGAYSGLFYMCSLNLYYLAKVKYNKTDSYIAKKLELWLHGVPTFYGLIVSVVLLAKQRMNASIDGSCSAGYAYEPPHCDGYQDGEIPEGFEIPCGRGRSAERILYITGFTTLFLVPITIGGSLWSIYRSVLRAEQRITRYGVGSLRFSLAQSTTNDAGTTNVQGGGSGVRRASSILSAVKRRFSGRGSRTSSNNQDSSQSRAVLQRAAAYSIAYFVTWIWTIIAGIVLLAGAWPSELPQPKWQIAYSYVRRFFNPLQGLWTLLIYMQPSVVNRKRSSDGNISWFGAFADALWSAVTGGNSSASRGGRRARMNQAPAPGPERRNTSATAGSTNRQGICARDPGECGRNQAGAGAPPAVAAPGRTGTNPAHAPGPEGRNTLATVGSTDRQGICAPVEFVGLEVEDAEEEKREIQECEPSV